METTIAWLITNWELVIGVLSMIEMIIGALPNNVVPYKSLILKLLSTMGSKSTKINDFEKTGIIKKAAIGIVIASILVGCEKISIEKV